MLCSPFSVVHTVAIFGNSELDNGYFSILRPLEGNGRANFAKIISTSQKLPIAIGASLISYYAYKYSCSAVIFVVGFMYVCRNLFLTICRRSYKGFILMTE